MFGSNYAWVILGEIRPSQIFAEDYKREGSLQCTSKQLKEAADRYISTMKLDIRQDNQKTLSGMVSLNPCYQNGKMRSARKSCGSELP